LVVLSTIALVGHRSALRWPGRRIGPVALVGIGDTGANLLFAYAATTGHLAVVGVLGSLYPVATVVLARWLLGERLSGGQNAGVALALTGVGLLAAARAAPPPPLPPAPARSGLAATGPLLQLVDAPGRLRLGQRLVEGLVGLVGQGLEIRGL